MPEIGARSYYPETKLVGVVRSEDMKAALGIHTAAGDYEKWPLDVKRATKLIRDLAAWVHDQEHFQPMGEGPERSATSGRV